MTNRLPPRTKIKIIVGAILLLVLFPHFSWAEVINSSNYNVENPQLDIGGAVGSSTNYGSRDAIGAEGDIGSNSANFKSFPGFSLPAYPGVPTQPTLTNTGGIMYNTLDFVLGACGTGGDTNNCVSTSYAIAISTDNFVTTNFVQASDSIGANPVWQTYTAWGGASGQRLVGLLYNTTYKIKIKAYQGTDAESGYSLTATAATVNPTLTMTVAGVNSGTTVAGVTTNITTTPTTVGFGLLQTGSIKLAAQTVTIGTNANSGYTVTLLQDHDLSKTTGTTIPAITATNASPAAWPGGITVARFGYHTTDSVLCTGTPGRFSANDTFAGATSGPAEVACASVPVTADATSLLFKLEIEALQPSGDYINQVSYIVTAQY